MRTIALSSTAAKRNITFLCSAFDPESADFLETLGVPAYKVASADLTNLPLLDHLAQKGKPLILSTGMSRMDEVECTVDFLKERQVEFALLHCNSTYPAAFEDINLRFMDQLRALWRAGGLFGSRAWHCRLHGGGCPGRQHHRAPSDPGPHHGWPGSRRQPGTAGLFKKMVRDIRQVAQALGTGEEKFISRGEISEPRSAGEKPGRRAPHRARRDDHRQYGGCKRTCLGISPQNYPALLGRSC